MSAAPSSTNGSQNKPSNYQYIFKLILIGNSGVGKSCILQRYMKHTFEESYKCTIGVDFLMKSIVINGQTVKLQLWDTAGQEKYKSMVSSYYRGANVALIVFDITNHQSFDSLPMWIENFYKNGPEQKNIILIGNKKDLADLRQVTQQEAEAFSETNNMMYFETSAKEGDNIEYIFNYAAEKLLEFYGKNNEAILKRQMTPNNDIQSSNFKEIRIEESPNKKKNCCV
jgi:small GTP-binding protein